MNLKENMIAAPNWPTFEPRFGAKRQFERHFWHLNTLRNALAHPTELIFPGDVRRDGEAALRWFQEALGVAPTATTQWRTPAPVPAPGPAPG